MKSSIAGHRNKKMPRLSAHEMAALMLLGYAPVELEVENPDMAALRDAGLAQRIDRETRSPEFSITHEGREMLLLLSMLPPLENAAVRPAGPDAP
jgi:hypothetical protein